VLPAGEDCPAWPGAPRLADAGEAVRLAASGRIREVYVALPGPEAARTAEFLALFAETPADLRLVPDLGATVLVNPGAAIVGGLPVVSVRERPLYGLRAAGKRGLDVLLALGLLVVLAPVLVLLAALVAATSRGPVLLRQERMGLDGRPFGMLKFRTMRADAETGTGPVFATRDDPRVTPLGRILRRLSLDELPQLWNVVRGEMSLVGPRPERGPFVEQFRSRFPGYMQRHAVKAGMTGWAQVNGLRGDSSLEDRLRYDLEYIDRWSLLFDLEILGRTAVQVVVGRNAY
jgi:exopolysaccharide biosynthesis polyprenyl glycosylphosphotransferase